MTLETAMRDWLNEGRTTWSAKTTQRRRSALRSYGRFLGYPDLLSDYRSPTAAPGEAHPLEGGIDTVVRLIDEAGNYHHKALIALCGLAGLRVNEAVMVEVSDVDFDDHMLLVHGKGSKDRRVPLSDRCWPFVAVAVGLAVRDGRACIVPVAERTARTIIKRTAARLGIDAASHDLRMTFGTAAYAKSLNLRAVQTLLGHASSKTTETYTGVSTTMMRGAADL